MSTSNPGINSTIGNHKTLIVDDGIHIHNANRNAESNSFMRLQKSIDELLGYGHSGSFYLNVDHLISVVRENVDRLDARMINERLQLIRKFTNETNKDNNQQFISSLRAAVKINKLQVLNDIIRLFLQDYETVIASYSKLVSLLKEVSGNDFVKINHALIIQGVLLYRTQPNWSLVLGVIFNAYKNGHSSLQLANLLELSVQQNPYGYSLTKYRNEQVIKKQERYKVRIKWLSRAIVPTFAISSIAASIGFVMTAISAIS